MSHSAPSNHRGIPPIVISAAESGQCLSDHLKATDPLERMQMLHMTLGAVVGNIPEADFQLMLRPPVNCALEGCNCVEEFQDLQIAIGALRKGYLRMRAQAEAQGIKPYYAKSVIPGA